eukprot:2685308-Pleurochrysis_carterae.AAC.2
MRIRRQLLCRFDFWHNETGWREIVCGKCGQERHLRSNAERRKGKAVPGEQAAAAGHLDAPLHAPPPVASSWPPCPRPTLEGAGCCAAGAPAPTKGHTLRAGAGGRSRLLLRPVIGRLSHASACVIACERASVFV